MTPAQIRDYATQASLKNGVNPAVTLGLIEHVSSYGTKFNNGKRLGLMGVQATEIQDKAAYLANPKAQIDSGLLKLIALKGARTDIEGAIDYLGDAKAASKAVMRGLKMTGEPVQKAAFEDIYKTTGGDLTKDMSKYDYQPSEPKQPRIAVPPTPEIQDLQGATDTAIKANTTAIQAPTMQDQTEDPRSTDLASLVFGKKNESPDDVLLLIDGVGNE